MDSESVSPDSFDAIPCVSQTANHSKHMVENHHEYSPLVKSASTKRTPNTDHMAM